MHDISALQVMQRKGGERNHLKVIESLEALSTDHDPYAEMVSLHNLRGSSYMETGDHKRAHDDFQTAIMFALPDRRANGDTDENAMLRLETVRGCSNLAELCMRVGDISRARNSIHNMSGYILERGISGSPGIADILLLLKAADLARLEHNDTALQLYSDALTLSERLAKDDLESRHLYGSALLGIAHRTRNPRNCAALADVAGEVFHVIGAYSDLVMAWMASGAGHLRSGARDKALNSFSQVSHMLSQYPDRRKEALFTLHKAEMQFAAGTLREAHLAPYRAGIDSGIVTAYDRMIFHNRYAKLGALLSAKS